MQRRRSPMAAAALAVALVAAVAVPVAVTPVATASPGVTASHSAAAPPATPAPPAPGWVLGTDRYSAADFSRQPYLGNGFLGTVLPATGQGYQGNLGDTGWPLYTPRYSGSFAAGFYGWSGASEFIAALPTWSTMTLGVGSAALRPGTAAEQISNYRQELDQRTGTATTAMTWTSPDGRQTDVAYEVFTDRTQAGVAAVRMTLRPRWSGRVTVDSIIDGSGARRVTAVGRATDPAAGTATVTVRGQRSSTGTDPRTAAVSTAVAGIPQGAAVSAVTGSNVNTAGQQIGFDVTAGAGYQLTKFVGVATTEHDADPTTAAAALADRARDRGWPALKAASDAAWNALWERRIEVADPDLQRRINASLYSLLASTRPGQQTSLAPGLLSSDTYAGMVFWDAETWMYPALLALQPELARSVVDLRFNTLRKAEQNAAEVGRSGAVWPWSAGPTMQCHGNGPCRNSQDHLQSEIALAQWQYYLATGDEKWLAERGWPVLQQLAVFWVNRAMLGDDGKYHVAGVDGADEYARRVTDHALTNAGAATTLRIAARAAELVGATADPRWTAVADAMYIPYDPATNTHPEYAGYAGAKIKQADVVLMAYPYEFEMPAGSVAADLDRYAAVSDPDGPAMTDSVHAILAAQVAEPGCQTWTYLQRSVEPFVREPFYSFAEARGDYAGDNAGAPAFVFGTGAGGFLQTVLYGLTGQRWRTDRVLFNPLLPPQLSGGVTIRGLQYQGRTVTATLGARTSTLRLDSGSALTVQSGDRTQTVAAGQSLTVPTRRPDLEPTPNLLRCKGGTATGSALGNYVSAANDGSASTVWRTADGKGSVTIRLPRPTPVGSVRVEWAGTLPTSARVETSRDGTSWTELGSLSDTDTDTDADAAQRTMLIGPVRPQVAGMVRVSVAGGDSSTGITEVAAFGPGNRGEPSTSIELPARVSTGTELTVSATVRNPTTNTLPAAAVTLSAPPGWSIADPVRQLGDLAPGATRTLRWTARTGDSTGPATVSVAVTWRGQSRPLTNSAAVTVLPPPPRGQAYLSDLPWLSAVGGFGPVERDRDNGERAAGDGPPLTLSGTVYPKGLGTNANSTIEYYLGGNCSRFTAVVGIDDSMVRSGGTQGDVVFRVAGDDAELATTGVVRGGDAPRPLSVDVTGVQTLTLQVDQWDQDNWWDHADWADAAVSCRP